MGAETGFRPDGRPIEVLESAGQNVLIVPPWDDRTAMLNLMASLQKDPKIWLLAVHQPEKGRDKRMRTTLERYGARPFGTADLSDHRCTSCPRARGRHVSWGSGYLRR